MILGNTYNYLKDKYGNVASWAIWSPANSTSKKSNTESLDVFQDPDLLDKLNAKYVFVALNAANHNCQKNPDWSFFHSSYRYQNDYKIRTATQGTRFEGSYITDIIKYHVETDSKKVMAAIKSDPSLLTKNLTYMQDELDALQNSNSEKKPVLIALGNDVYRLLMKHFHKKGYEVVKVKHYAGYFSDDYYKAHFTSVLAHI